MTLFWVLIGLGGAVLMATLGMAQLMQPQPSSTSSRTGGRAHPISGQGALVAGNGSQVQASGPSNRTVALTFDDGPDPAWTPKILDVLQRYHVPATFFMVGANVTRHPALARRVVREGNEVGSHTFTHADLASLPGWRARAELSLNQAAFAGVLGRHTAVLRPPYSSTTQAITDHDFPVVRLATQQGYLVALADYNSNDWDKVAVDVMVRLATPPPGEGGVILMHDGGGDRSKTVDTLNQLIPALQEQGYTFKTVSEVAGLPGRGMPPVPTVEHWRGMALLVVTRVALGLKRLILAFTIGMIFLLLLRTAVQLILALVHARRLRGRELSDLSFQPPVSVIVPAYNEEVGIADAVRSLANSSYRAVEVVVVDDGSTDGTAAAVENLGLPNVVLVRQANGGKSSALNTGIAWASHDVLVAVDGDTIFEPDTLKYIVGPFRDSSVGAVSGNIKVGNRGGLLGRWQHIEYVIGCGLDRRAYDILGCITTIPGAIGAFRREALQEVGGFSTETFAEDTDLTMAITRAGWRVTYESRARAWTEVPVVWRDLWRQRYRWAYGNLQCVWKHRRALGRRGDRVGRRALPYLIIFQIVLPLLAPFIDVIALYDLLLGGTRAPEYWLLFTVFQVLIGAVALKLDGERLRTLWSLPLQQFLYRQFMYLVVIQACFSAVVGERLRWHKLARVGGLEVAGPAVELASAQ